jgi:FG-GAP repeat
MYSIVKVHDSIEKEGYANNSCQERKTTTLDKTDKFSFHFNFNLRQNIKNHVIILFTIFSIILPIVMGPDVQTNYVFGQSDSSSENEDVEYNEEADNSYLSSFKTEWDQKDPFNSPDSDINNVNENIILPDIIEPDQRSNIDSSSTVSSESQLESSPQQKYKSPPDHINTSNIKAQSATETDDKPGTESSYVDSQVSTDNSIINNSIQEANENALSENQPTITEPKYATSSQSESESEPSAQPTYKSYRDFMDNNSNSSSQESDDLTEKPQNDELNYEDSQMFTANNNIKLNLDTKNDVTIIAPDHQSSTQSSLETPTSEIRAQWNEKVYGDFNGDEKDDVAIGVPLEDVDIGGTTIIDAGAVNVLYGSSNGLSATSPEPDEIWTQGTTDVNDVPEEGDLFGSSLSAGDFNGDGFDDLAIGVTQEDVDTGRGTIGEAGAINVLYGSSNGLSATSPTPDQFWTQDSPHVNDVPEEGDLFGSSLSAGDFNGDEKDDLAIGVQFEDVETGEQNIVNAGAINILYGSSNGLSATSPTPDQFWTQDSPHVNDVPEEGDLFGSSLSAGDFNGDEKDDVAIGVLGEDTKANILIVNGAGAFNALYGTPNGLSATSPLPD